MTREYAVVVDRADILGIHSCAPSEDGSELVIFYDLKNSDLTGVATHSLVADMSPIRATLSDRASSNRRAHSCRSAARRSKATINVQNQKIPRLM
jgi:hypothetical protein